MPNKKPTSFHKRIIVETTKKKSIPVWIPGQHSRAFVFRLAVKHPEHGVMMYSVLLDEGTEIVGRVVQRKAHLYVDLVFQLHRRNLGLRTSGHCDDVCG